MRKKGGIRELFDLHNLMGPYPQHGISCNRNVKEKCQKCAIRKQRNQTQGLKNEKKMSKKGIITIKTSLDTTHYKSYTENNLNSVALFLSFSL